MISLRPVRTISVWCLSHSTGILEHTDGGEFGAHVDDHDDRHYQGQNVHEVVGALEDDGVCQLNRPRVALRLYARAAVDGRDGPNEGTQRYRRLFAYRREVAEAHL